MRELMLEYLVGEVCATFLFDARVKHDVTHRFAGLLTESAHGNPEGLFASEDIRVIRELDVRHR
jgi:hypothetical protein